MGARGVVEQAGIGGDDGVGAQLGRAVDCRLPVAHACGAGVGVERDVDLAATPVRIGDASAQVFLAEVQARERARIGLVAKAQIDGIGACVDRGGETGQVAGRADEQHGRASGEGGRMLLRWP